MPLSVALHVAVNWYHWPEVYIGAADKLFDANGELVNDGTRKFLEGFMHAYAKWVAANHQL